MDDLFPSTGAAEPRKHYDFYNLHAREKLGMPDTWQWFRLEAKGENFTVITGAICTEVYLRGKRKGRTNWAKRDKETELPVTISRDEHKAWLLAWEKRTGECHQCSGNGQQWTGWSRDEGNKFRPCTRCDSTGAAPKAGEA